MKPDASIKTDNHELSAFLWLYFPIGLFLIRYLAHWLKSSVPQIEALFIDELGIIENLTVCFLVFTIFLTLHLVIKHRKYLDVYLKIFLALYVLGCIYFAGEEASWGQHWFGWETNEYFKTVNDQKETNLHNTHIWLDRRPKGIISLLIGIGGILVPIIFYCKQIQLTSKHRFWWIWPTLITMPTAIFVTIATWPSKIENEFNVQFYFDQAQEMKECYIAFFILLYMASLTKRLPLMHESAEPTQQA